LEGPKIASKSTLVLLFILLLFTPLGSFNGLLCTALKGSLEFENASLGAPNGSFVSFDEKLDELNGSDPFGGSASNSGGGFADFAKFDSVDEQ
jgi:hypothetical protein